MPSTRLTRLKRLRLKLDIDRPAAHAGESRVSHTSRVAQPTASAPDSQALGDEAADVLGMLLIYCARAGIDLDEAMQRKWLKWLEPQA